jgi:ankyrin repeat protein
MPTWAAAFAVLTLAGLFPQEVTELHNLAKADELNNAVRAGSLSEVLNLLNQGADVNGRNSLGSTPLLEATWSGNLEIAQILLAHGADVNARRLQVVGTSGVTPLQYSVLVGRTPFVKLLLQHDARVDLTDRNGQTVLHVAAARGNVPITQLLLDAHANLNATDREQNTPLDYAIMHGQSATAPILNASTRATAANRCTKPACSAAPS